MSDRQVLLKVENLEQFFSMGKKKLKAVNDISFDIYKGEVFGLVGESGCGKTTTGRTIIRLYRATGGSVYFRGQRIGAGVRRYKEEIRKLRKERSAQIAEIKKQDNTGGTAEEIQRKRAETEQKLTAVRQKYRTLIEAQQDNIKSAHFDHRHCDRMYAQKQAQQIQEKYLPQIEAATDSQGRAQLKREYKEDLRLAKKDRIMNKMQMIFQDPIASLNPRMTVREIISEGLVIRGIKDKEVIDRQVYRMLDLVGLVPEHANRYPHEFSGGQRQRIGIARAVILNPELIIADEPISALDVSIQAQVINLLNELRETLGLTILFIAHDLSVVKYFSDRIAVMYFGKIVELADSDELFKNPLHPYTRSLLSAIPLPDPDTEKQRKRILYNPIAEHDYKTDMPKLTEVAPGHFVQCNAAELKQYKQQLGIAEELSAQPEQE